jgi:hypothetical protein
LGGLTAKSGTGIQVETNQVEESAHYRSPIKLSATVEGIRAKILVDCGASGNFIDEVFVRQNRLTTEIINRGRLNEVTLADGSKKRISERIREVSIEVEPRYRFKTSFSDAFKR